MLSGTSTWSMRCKHKGECLHLPFLLKHPIQNQLQPVPSFGRDTKQMWVKLKHSAWDPWLAESGWLTRREVNNVGSQLREANNVWSQAREVSNVWSRLKKVHFLAQTKGSNPLRNRLSQNLSTPSLEMWYQFKCGDEWRGSHGHYILVLVVIIFMEQALTNVSFK